MLSTYVRTIRHLKTKQIVWRVRKKIPYFYIPASRLMPVRRPLKMETFWQGGRSPSFVSENTFNFLNCNFRTTSWDPPECEDLWVYNLHYFDDLNAEGCESRTSLQERIILRWIQENPCGKSVGWDSYPISKRVVNWIKWLIRNDNYNEVILKSLVQQAKYLRRNLEWDLMANHLLVNFKALIFLGVFFDGPKAKEWLRTALKQYRRQLREQILIDGGHFERSPMYHALVLEDLLDLAQLSKLYPNTIDLELEHHILKMGFWLENLVHDDGGLSFFNDSVDEESLSCKTLNDRAQKILGVSFPETKMGGTLLEPSGFFRFQCPKYTMIVDVGSVGPSYQPGHAHAGTFSFETSQNGKRVFVNKGISTYQPGPTRAEERSTRSHNTVTVDQSNSSEVWSSFRVGGRARVIKREYKVLQGEHHLTLQHDGYKTRYDVLHERRFVFSDDGFTIKDRIPARAQMYLHCHPDVSLQKTEMSFEFKNYGNLIQTAFPSVLETYYSPKFGIQIPTKVLKTDFTNELITRWKT